MGRKEQTKPKATTKKKIIKTRAETNEIGNQNNTEIKWNQKLILWKELLSWIGQKERNKAQISSITTTEERLLLTLKWERV